MRKKDQHNHHKALIPHVSPLLHGPQSLSGRDLSENLKNERFSSDWKPRWCLKIVQPFLFRWHNSSSPGSSDIQVSLLHIYYVNLRFCRITERFGSISHTLAFHIQRSHRHCWIKNTFPLLFLLGALFKPRQIRRGIPSPYPQLKIAAPLLSLYILMLP